MLMFAFLNPHRNKEKLREEILLMKERRKLFYVMHALFASDFSYNVEDYTPCFIALMKVKGYRFKLWEDLDENEMDIVLERFDGFVVKMFNEYINTKDNFKYAESFIQECEKFIIKDTP